MNRVVLQLWEESEKGSEVRPDGCSLHIDSQERKRYIDSVYSLRKGQTVPSEYERIVGSEMTSFVDDALFDIIKRDKTVRLSQYELNNLINIEDLLIKD